MVVHSEAAAQQDKRDRIREFLSLSRFAAVGVSKNPRDFTRALMRSFVERGYDVVPVNPAAAEMDGRKCYASVRDIQPPVTAALVLTSPTVTEQVVPDCAAAGISLIWMYRATGAGAVSHAAVDFCHEHGIAVIAGECPFMFFPHAGFIHQVHGLIRRIAGTYPR